jgi:hypothetical protein
MPLKRGLASKYNTIKRDICVAYNLLGNALRILEAHAISLIRPSTAKSGTTLSMAAAPPGTPTR